MPTPRPAFGYGQALPDTTATELRSYKTLIRRWARGHGFLVVGMFIDPHPERAPQFVRLIKKMKRLEVRPTTVIVPNVRAFEGAGTTSVEKLFLLRLYDLHLEIADEG
jgi:hypothetical protein